MKSDLLDAEKETAVECGFTLFHHPYYVFFYSFPATGRGLFNPLMVVTESPGLVHGRNQVRLFSSPAVSAEINGDLTKEREK